MRPSRRTRDERGVTLIEALLVILLVSTIILSLAAGLVTSTIVARRTNDAQRLSLGMTAFTEGIRDLPYYQGPVGCTPVSDAAAYLQRYNDLPPEQRAATDGLTLEVVEIQYWKGNRGDASLPPVPAADQWTANCGELGGAQKLRLRVGVAREGTSASAEIVKRSGSRLG